MARTQPAPRVLSLADTAWDKRHEDDTLHTVFDTATIPFPEGTADDPDWIEVRRCIQCQATQPHHSRARARAARATRKG